MMNRRAMQLWNDERGYVVSSELVLVSTVGVLSMATGLARISDDVNAELKQVGAAVRSIEQPAMPVTLTGSRLPSR